jgi:hypothetical protein
MPRRVMIAISWFPMGQEAEDEKGGDKVEKWAQSNLG